MTDYKTRIYPYPSTVRCCVNCEGFKVTYSADRVRFWKEIKCSVFNKIITRAMFVRAMDGEFPEFCKLEEVHGDI